jgi:hypothetical protein
MNKDIIKPAEMGYVGEDADGNFVKVSRKDWLQFLKLMRHVQRAEQLHPSFGEGIYEAIGKISEEGGELAHAANHNEGEQRIMEEGLDLLCVAWRFVREDWRV